MVLLCIANKLLYLPKVGIGSCIIDVLANVLCTCVYTWIHVRWELLWNSLSSITDLFQNVLIFAYLVCILFDFLLYFLFKFTLSFCQDITWTHRHRHNRPCGSYHSLVRLIVVMSINVKTTTARFIQIVAIEKVLSAAVFSIIALTVG